MTTSVSKKATILKPAFAFLSLFLTILHVLLVKGRDLVTFTWTEHSRLYIGVIVLLAVLFTYFFYLCLTHTLYYIGKKNKTFLSYFRFFIGYFLFMGVFWLLPCPVRSPVLQACFIWLPFCFSLPWHPLLLSRFCLSARSFL